MVSARMRPAVSQAGLRAAAQARTPVAAAVAVAAVAMHCAHTQSSMAKTATLARAALVNCFPKRDGPRPAGTGQWCVFLALLAALSHRCA
jgi:hypothetical protein